MDKLGVTRCREMVSLHFATSLFFLLKRAYTFVIAVCCIDTVTEQKKDWSTVAVCSIYSLNSPKMPSPQMPPSMKTKASHGPNSCWGVLLLTMIMKGAMENIVPQAIRR